MACPHVAGVVAMALEANPYLRFEQVHGIIMNQTKQELADDVNGRGTNRERVKIKVNSMMILWLLCVIWCHLCMFLI